MTGTVSAERNEDDAGTLADAAVALVGEWLERATNLGLGTRAEERLSQIVEDPDGVAFAMQFVDRVARPEANRPAAHQLRALVHERNLPGFLSSFDRTLTWIGGRIATLAPWLVMPMARRRLRAMVGHLVVDADDPALQKHLSSQADAGYTLNVNLLGESVLGEAGALKRLEATVRLLQRPDVDYVSVKISSIASQLNLWAFEESLERICERLRVLYDAALDSPGPKFVNLDMEEYADFDLTITAFTTVLDEDRFRGLTAGIVLQAYLPDSFGALQQLSAWAERRVREGGAAIKIRLVKGANLAMERVEAAMHGWEQAPYATKAETDANYKRCLDWVMRRERMRGLRIGVASHNLFDVAWAFLLSDKRGVVDRVDFEMLQGMAPAQAEVLRTGVHGFVLYTPVVTRRDFHVAISYLFRRLEENAAKDHFIRHLFTLTPDSKEFADQERRFRQAVDDHHLVSDQARRTQDRAHPEFLLESAGFANEPDTDPALPVNRDWAEKAVARHPDRHNAPMTTDIADVDEAISRAVSASSEWATRSAANRRAVLWAVADELARQRATLISAMVHEASKTVAEADPEVSEAIDFARWYGDQALNLETMDGARFSPLGVVAVVPPWNFPVAIPAGGVLAALAAGNTVVLKPAPQTPRCAEIVAEACWEAGVPADALQFVRTPDNEVGQHLITHQDIDAVILTGSLETAHLFRGWRSDLRLFGETSGKNALIVTPHADLDLAAADLVHSAFGHSGQKCSAASLGILVGDVYESERFRRQLLDGASSLAIGATTDKSTVMGPVILPAAGKLQRAFTTLDQEEEWLLEPWNADGDGRLWTPGIRLGVRQDSWFHRTECFGPVLGLMRARDLDHAIALQNGSNFGLTGGIHSLDPAEVDHWLERVEVGNAYVNRHITGAIVRRQPFGGWKESVVGPGAKAGGPNYLLQLGTWTQGRLPSYQADLEPAVADLLDRLATNLSDDDFAWLKAAAQSDQYWWEQEFSVDHDPSSLGYEANIFRYRPLPAMALRIESDAVPLEAVRTVLAATRAGVSLTISVSEPSPLLQGATVQQSGKFAAGAAAFSWQRIRHLGTVPAELSVAALRHELTIIDAPVTPAGRVELLYYLHEQSIARTMHRYGHMVR